MLIGTHICLGPFFRPDASVLFNWRNRVDLMRLDGLYRPVSEANFHDWFDTIGKDPARVVFAIRRRSDLALAGFLQIVGIQATHRSAELGLMIGEDADRGRGFGSEALGLAIPFCWDELNLRRLTLMVVGENARARGVYERAGFRAEGRLRQAVYAAGEYRDVTLMALLREARPAASSA